MSVDIIDLFELYMPTDKCLQHLSANFLQKTANYFNNSAHAQQ